MVGTGIGIGIATTVISLPLFSRIEKGAVPCVFFHLGWSIPSQRPARLILRNARFEAVLLLLQVDHFGHPGEGVGDAGEHLVEADLLATAVGDEARVFLELAGVRPSTPRDMGVIVSDPLCLSALCSLFILVTSALSEFFTHTPCPGRASRSNEELST